MKQYIEQNINILDDYCKNIGLSKDKVWNSPKCYGKDFMIIQHRSGITDNLGLNDTKPAKILLVIRKTEDGVTFEPSEDIYNYLS